MPLTAKGEKIMKALKAEYGAEKGEEVFYSMKNLGKISGVDAARADMTDDEWDELRALLDKFFGEESKEEEHREDASMDKRLDKVLYGIKKLHRRLSKADGAGRGCD